MHAGCALIGGETAEHPVLLGTDDYDVAGAGTGVVEADGLLGADRVATAMSRRVGLSGLHSNGFSLARHVLLDRGRPGARSGRRRAGPQAGRRTAGPRPASTPGTAWPSRACARCMRSAISPGAGWPTTCRGCCPASAPPSTGPAGLRRRSSAWSAASGAVPPRRSRDVEHGGRHGRRGRGRDADRAVRHARRPGHTRLGARHRGRRRSGAVAVPGRPPGLTGTSPSDTAPLDAANGCWVR